MTVVALTVDSFKRLRAARVHPSPHGLVPVRGRNEQGKSSLIESMLAALGGKRNAPELPITEGAHGAEVMVDLGDLVVRRKWKRDAFGKATSALTVEASGSKLASPQGVLDNLVAKFADPVAFLEMKPEEQVRTVLAVSGLDAALGRLEAQAQELFEARRDAGREADRLTKAEQALAAEVAGLPPPPHGEDVTALAKRLQEARAANEEVRALQTQEENLRTSGLALNQRIKDLRTELERLEAEQVALRKRWQEVHGSLQKMELVDEQPILDALARHQEASKFEARRAVYQETASAAAAARERHQVYEAQLVEARSEIDAMLASAEMPLPGMAYDPERKLITLKGIPFSSASQAERIKVAAAVAMSGDPPIRVMFAREGSLLDEESRAQLAQLAEERGWQLWIEIVDSNPEGAGVWVEDGEAFGPPEPAG